MTRSCDEGCGGPPLFASIISVKWEAKVLAQSEKKMPVLAESREDVSFLCVWEGKWALDLSIRSMIPHIHIGI